MSIEIVALFI